MLQYASGEGLEEWRLVDHSYIAWGVPVSGGDAITVLEP